MIEHKNIQEAIRAIYAEVGYVQKQHSAELRYTFAGEAAFIAELRPAMIEHGVTVSVANMSNLTQETYTTARGTVMMRSTIHAIVRFQHVTGSQIDVEAYGEGSDSGDKSVNKAMTDAYKYALRQTFMIETGDDPDKDESQERNTNSNYKAKPEKLVNQSPLPEMSLQLAESEKNAAGALYGTLDTETLVHMANTLAAMKQRTEEQERKLTAARTILKSRSSSSAA
jgi:hypothetical protein